jgi:hypothetical protein
MRHSRVARRKARSRPQTIAYKLHNCLSPESATSTTARVLTRFGTASRSPRLTKMDAVENRRVEKLGFSENRPKKRSIFNRRESMAYPTVKKPPRYSMAISRDTCRVPT